MKRAIIIAMFVLACTFSFAAGKMDEGSSVGNPLNDNAGVIINHYATRAFIAGDIPQEDLDLLIQAGVRAPSAANRQPWHFTVVQDFELAQRVVPQSVEGNILIVISAAGDSITNVREILDCALATQSIYLQAQVMGYGSRIYTGPINNLNQTLKKDLELPEGYSAVALIRIGKIEGNVDAVSAASSRKDAETMLNYK